MIKESEILRLLQDLLEIELRRIHNKKEPHLSIEASEIQNMILFYSK